MNVVIAICDVLHNTCSMCVNRESTEELFSLPFFNKNLTLDICLRFETLHIGHIMKAS